MAGSPARRWFLREPSPSAGARLFLLPYSGCGASMYRQWPRTVGDIEMVAVQPPGRENRLREEPVSSYAELAAGLTDALAPYLDRPFGLFGHCASALAAFETAAVLQRRGLPTPARLFVSSQVPPHLGPHGRFLRMTDDELRAEVRTLIEGLGGVARPDMVELSLEVLRADVEVNKRYRLAAPIELACPITALGWRGDVEVDHHLMAEWSKYGNTTFHLLDGEHYRFMAGPPELMDVLSLDLVRVRAG